MELGRSGDPITAAEVLFSRDYPNGVVVPIDGNLGSTAVRYLRWDIDRWNGGTFSSTSGRELRTKGWVDNPTLTARDDIVPGRDRAPLRFMAPYPGSNFKLMVAFQTLRLVDRGILRLDGPYTYNPQGGCLASAGGMETNRQWLDAMITASDNRSACALVKQLHQLRQIAALNGEFRSLGLGTLQLNGTSGQTGYNWQPGQIDMTALDTARLLLLINGAPGVLWRTPGGQPVTANVLSRSSRALFKSLLAQQGYNDTLSTTNWCGVSYPAPGIPQRVASRWIDRVTGTVTVEGKDYGQNVRPCNAAAQVTFAHKTGLTYNYSSDAG